MTARANTAKRLREHREDMELALAEGISLAAARYRRFEQRWAEIAARRAERDGVRRPITSAQQPERPILWYQRDDL